MAKGPRWTAEERAGIREAFVDGRRDGRTDAEILALLESGWGPRSRDAIRLEARRMGLIQPKRESWTWGNPVRRLAVPA